MDVLVNNAVHTGPGSMERFLDLDIDMVTTKLEANVVAQLVMIKAVLPGHARAGRWHDHRHHVGRGDERPSCSYGRGWMGGSGMHSPRERFTGSRGILAVELGSQGIFIVNVEPGYVLTERMVLAQERIGLAGRYPGAPRLFPARWWHGWQEDLGACPATNARRSTARRSPRSASPGSGACIRTGGAADPFVAWEGGTSGPGVSSKRT